MPRSRDVRFLQRQCLYSSTWRCVLDILLGSSGLLADCFHRGRNRSGHLFLVPGSKPVIVGFSRFESRQTDLAEQLRGTSVLLLRESDLLLRQLLLSLLYLCRRTFPTRIATLDFPES